MTLTKAGMTEKKCKTLGIKVANYNSIILSSDNKQRCVCLPCYNKKISEAIGIDYDHL